jgi:transposase
MGTDGRKPRVFAGIDVSAKELVVALVRGKGEVLRMTFSNCADGHRKLARALTHKGGASRVVLEATGNFHLDPALVLAAEPTVEVMVVNPMAARRFAQAQMRRAKTDKVDALVLLEFAQRMACERWVPPSEAALELRAVTRHLAGLTAHQTVLKNQLAAAKATSTTPAYIHDDLLAQLEAVAQRISACHREALRVASADPELSRRLESLTSIPGIAARSGVQILGELCVLAVDMSPDEVVAHSGLDPRPKQSGTTNPQRKISKMGNSRLRGALYMPAVTASRCSPAVSAWYSKLTEKGKPPFVAHVAVMRRMLRVAWVLMTRSTTWTEELFRPREAVRQSA